MRAKVLTFLALLAIASSVSAQVPMMSQTTPWYNSFRNQSTAQLLEDNLDLMLGRWGYLDPARIGLIEGRYLYTNLANIYTQNEEQFNPTDAGTYVIGGNTEVFGYGKLGLLYSHNKYLQSDSTATDNAHLVDVDPGVNPGYDFRQTQTDADKWTDQYGESDYFLGWAKQVNDMRLGVAFKRTSYSSQYDERNISEILNQNIATGAVIYTKSSDDSTCQKYASTENWFGGSVWKPINDKMDASLRLAIGMGGIENLNDYTSVLDSVYPGGDSYNQTEDSLYDSKYSGFAFSGGGAYVYKWTEAMNTRFDLQYTHLGYKPDGEIAWEYTYHDQSNTLDPEFNDVSRTDAVEGELSQNTIDFRVVNTAKLDKAVFAIGLGFKTNNYELTETHDRASVDRYEFRDDNISTLPTSYVQTATWGENWDYMFTAADYTLSFPVAVEFSMTKNICFRLGATHYIGNYDETDTEILTGGSAVISTETVYGDGTRDITYTPNPLDDETGNSQTNQGKSSYTNYTYGAGWKVTENLQLDFMGFAQLTDLTNWKLSAVFKF